MPRFVIQGRRRLSGTFQPAGNKNAALPMLAAALLTDQPVVLHNVPNLLDVVTMLELLASLGVSISRRGASVTLRAAGIRRRRLNRELCSRVRSSILLAGPLVARFGRAVLYPPGGDVIGRRRLDDHLNGLRALGITSEKSDFYTFRRNQLRGADILLEEPSVTATENVLMAACLADGTTTIFNAACEPHVVDLGNLLLSMGARIEGLGTNRIVVEGVKSLGGATHRIGPDHIEVGSMIAAVAATGGELCVEGAGSLDTLAVLEPAYRRLGLSWEVKDGAILVPGKQKLCVSHREGTSIPKIEDGPWPLFPSDLMSVLIVLATQVRGTVLFFEKMFESRMYFVDRLLDMGAQVIQCDPHRVVVAGPSRLQGTHLAGPDIRAGMGLIIAALCARGQSIIENAQVVDRGYERLEVRLRALGADMVRED